MPEYVLSVNRNAAAYEHSRKDWEDVGVPYAKIPGSDQPSAFEQATQTRLERLAVESLQAEVSRIRSTAQA